MHSRDDDIHNLTEADRTSETRFGPRPVPKGHRTASPYKHRPMKSSKVIPSAPMSPDGRRAYPTPSLSSKIIVWGGVAVGVAGLTAGALMAARKLSGSSDDDRRDALRSDYRRNEQALAPRFAAMDEDEREEMRRRVRDRARQDREKFAGSRSDAAQRRARAAGSTGNIARDLTNTANDLSGGLEGFAKSMLSAFQGFRSVASQASGIVGEFASTAEHLRTVMPSGEADRPGDAGKPAREKRTHNL